MGSCSSRQSNIDFDGEVNFNHFSILRAIGRGSYGKVCIVKKKDTKELYAMKYMNKAKMIRKDAVKNVVREQEMLIDLDHANIVKLWFSFQDEEDLFMVVDLLLGGDLGYHLEKFGRMTLERIKFYIAEISMALDYLQTKSIIHRDVKPANLLLHANGHIYLSDFNVATYVTANKPITSMTGTKPYMAPEMYSPSPEGYSFGVDWWSLGVTAYQLLRGRLPFQISFSERPSTVAEHLSRQRNLSVSTSWDQHTCHLIYGLIEPDPSQRITSLTQLQKEPFYEDEEWENITTHRFTPPYLPPKNRIFCDPTHELEEMIIEPNPLHKKTRRLQRRRSQLGSSNHDTATADQTADISHLFSPYDRFKSKGSKILPVFSNDGSDSLKAELWEKTADMFIRLQAKAQELVQAKTVVEDLEEGDKKDNILVENSLPA